MQEISPHVFIETSYPGVTLGAISSPHGLVLLDSPFRADDARLWRAAPLNPGGGVDRVLVILDAHFDRTLGARAMECTIVGHEKLAEVFRNRPVTFKTQGNETGAEWEQYNGLGSIRWAPPEITFSHTLTIHWGDTLISLEYHPGPAAGAIWAVLPDNQVIFLGDAVLPNQPPFLASADLPMWIASLRKLLTPEYQNHLLVCGRGELLTQQDVRTQLSQLEKIHQMLSEMPKDATQPEDTQALIAPLLREYDIPEQQKAHFEQRLRWGLCQYYTRHYHPADVSTEE